MTRTVCVDDSPASRYIITRMLRQAGHEVVEGTTAAEALRLMLEQRPDLLVLDVNLPDGNGREVCAEIRKDPRIAHTPILLISASSVESADKIDGLKRGADAYVIEPVEREEFEAIVNALLRMSRAERQVQGLNEQLSARVHELETLIETVPVGIGIAADPQCSQIRINTHMAEIVGTSAQTEIRNAPGIVKPYTVLTDGAPLPLQDHPLQRAVAHNAPVRNQEFEVLRSDGRTVKILANATPMHGPAGEVTGAVGAFVDVTERKRSQARQRMIGETAMLLSESLALETTLARVADLAVRFLADWCVVDLVRASGHLERLSITHRDPAMAPVADQLRRFDPDPKRLTPIFTALESGHPLVVNDIESLMQRMEPEFLDLVRTMGMRSFMAVPLLARGRAIGVLSLVNASTPYEAEDVTSANDLAVRAALALDNALLYRAATEANRAKDEFLAMVSHELRTPLTAIAGWVGVLRHDPADSGLVEQATKELHQSSDALRRLVDDLLDVSRIVAGKLTLEPEPIELAPLLRAAAEAVRPAAEAKSIGIDLDLDRPAMILGDPLRVQQIAANLLTNAVKFTPGGGRISVVLDPQDDAVSFSVSDTGRGISAQFIPHLFERFSQAERSSRSPGLGLGLAMVKDLTEMHGGRVEARSEGPGKGACFTVTLPPFPHPATG